MSVTVQARRLADGIELTVSVRESVPPQPPVIDADGEEVPESLERVIRLERSAA